LYFGGRGQDSVGLLPKLSEVFFDVRVITFNYRGYGKSQGEPSEQKLYDDALEIYKKVYKHYGDVVVLGFSLGSSIASYLASKTDIKKLFIVGAFSSLNDLIKDKYGFRFPFLKYGFYTCKYLQESDAKVYIFVSKDDNVVPFNDSFRLENCPKNLERFVVVSGVNHIELLWHKDVIKEIKKNLV
jgi:pimeloyl-ACP methyl ester carboxylesterase